MDTMNGRKRGGEEREKLVWSPEAEHTRKRRKYTAVLFNCEKGQNTKFDEGQHLL